MMDEHIGVSLDRVRNCIQKIGKNEFTTAEVIRKYLGHFCSDIGTSPSHSFNAQFGALLKRNELLLEIEEIKKNVPIEDDHRNKTTTSLWRIK
jgi:hypothetical protein